MSDDKTVTERDAVLREREAFARGAQWAWFNNYAESYGAKFNHEGYVDLRAAERYPLPTITRLREVPDPEPGFDQRWRCVDGSLQYRHDGIPWIIAHNGKYVFPGNVDWPTPRRIALWADLRTNPTEEVTA